MNILPKDFYCRNDVLLIAKELLGKKLVTNFEGTITAGMIVETEAYMAPEDKASHAFGNKQTVRTGTFFKEGGIAYVYLCYGIHHLFNIITNQVSVPHAVLIRAVEPVTGVEKMMERRGHTKLKNSLTSGPGSLSAALGIHKSHNAYSLQGPQIWVEDIGIKVINVSTGPRIGVGYAEEYSSMPWRFWISGNPWVSKSKN